jgi:hypothetical protein
MVRARKAQALLPERAAQWERGRDPAYVKASEANRQEFFALLLELDGTLSGAQRARAQERLRRYAGDIVQLARRTHP